MSLLKRPVIYSPRARLRAEIIRRCGSVKKAAILMGIEWYILEHRLAGGCPMPLDFARRLSLATGIPVEDIVRPGEDA